MNFYPPFLEPERVIGLNRHVDISGITLLLECGVTPRLQVLKDENWVNVEPVNGAIVVNLGHIMEIINHGAFDESLSNMREQAQKFFDLPLQEKKRCAQKPGSVEAYGQAFVTYSVKQKLPWNDMLFLKTLPLQNLNLNFWPENPQVFR
nr:s-norcoclaurine synthase 1 [Quercus suber]